MNLYRRWDERLGRHRPDSELGKRGRRRQKHSIFTEAKLAPPPDASDLDDEDVQTWATDQHHVAPQLWSPRAAQSTQGVGESPRQPDQSMQLASQPAPALNRSMDPDIAGRDA